MIRKILIVAVAAGAMISCSPEEKSDLDFSIKSSSANLINGSASSCKQTVESASSSTVSAGDLKPYYFLLLSPTLRWSGKGEAVIFNIALEMKSAILSSGKYECIIAGEEMGWLFASKGSDGVLTPWNAQLDETVTSVSVNSLCMALKCGGVGAPADQPFAAEATITVDGVQIASDGEQTPLRATTTVSIENLP